MFLQLPLAVLKWLKPLKLYIKGTVAIEVDVL